MKKTAAKTTSRHMVGGGSEYAPVFTRLVAGSLKMTEPKRPPERARSEFACGPSRLSYCSGGNVAGELAPSLTSPRWRGLARSLAAALADSRSS